MQVIKLTRGRLAISDDGFVKNWHNWRTRGHAGEVVYAVRTVDGRCFKMHHEVMGLRPGDLQYVRHINGNTLDNRRCNLEFTHKRPKNKKTTNLTKDQDGVFYLDDNNYLAQITVDGRILRLGYYGTEDAAIAAYTAKAEDMYE